MKMVTMRRSVLAALALGLSADALFSHDARPTPPPTRREDVREVLHDLSLQLAFLAGELGMSNR